MESTGITSFNTVFVIFHSPDIVTLLVKNKLQESSAAAERCEERTWFNVQRARQRETERKREREIIQNQCETVAPREQEENLEETTVPRATSSHLAWLAINPMVRFAAPSIPTLSIRGVLIVKRAVRVNCRSEAAAEKKKNSRATVTGELLHR